MSHIDDGRLNALLDGELDAAEAEAVRTHIAACAECARRLDEAKQFLAGAADLLGTLELPPTVNVAPAAPPVRRVSKTAKEVAIDIDGATHKSPAIRPNLPEPAPAPAARPHFDFTTLSWAAMVVLAIGVGYLANEVRHTRGGPQGEGAASRDQAVAPAAAPSPAASRPVRGGTTQVTRGSRPGVHTAAAPPTHAARGGAAVASKSTKPPSGKRLAATAATRRNLPANAAARNDLAAATGAAALAQEGAAERRTADASSAAPTAHQPVAGNAAALSVTGAAARRDAPAAFRRTTLENAVAHLDGVIRLVDGMRIEQVEIGPGQLVSGADHTRDLVRLVYFDAAGRRLVLDQQRLALAAAGAAVSADIGMRLGDTLTTTAPQGATRVRWISGTFWLSLSGTVPPEELRGLIERVR